MLGDTRITRSQGYIDSYSNGGTVWRNVERNNTPHGPLKLWHFQLSSGEQGGCLVIGFVALGGLWCSST